MTQAEWDAAVLEETLAGMRVYNPGQLARVAGHLPRRPKWVVIGGPSCADESQTARKVWPGVKVLACEPSPVMRAWQARHGFEGVMVAAALAAEPGAVAFRSVTGPTGGSTQPGYEDRPVATVPAVTLDGLDAAHGPFEDALVWLDIEGAELAALRGGAGLFASGRVLAVNVEASHRNPDAAAAVRGLLAAAGLTLALTWNTTAGPYHDELWVRA